MLRFLSLLVLGLILSPSAAAQNKSKPWTEWSKKETEKMLNESAWGQTQVESNTSEITATPTSALTSTTAARTSDATSVAGSRAESGAYNQAVFVKYRIRFLSAKPIRAAVAQTVNLSQTPPNPKVVEQMQPFVERNFAEQGVIVVTVTLESNDPRFGNPAQQELNSANSGSWKNSTYLERKDGKRLFLEDYRAPINDGLGAKFIFPRLVEGKPFLDEASGEVRFVAETGKRIKLNMRFKVKDMMYNGQLEY
jgi:hypothetical protein